MSVSVCVCLYDSTRVRCRYKSARVSARGLFEGARVVRGRDWKWGDQDGGEGREGTVVEIAGWQSESSVSQASVCSGGVLYCDALTEECGSGGVERFWSEEEV